MVRLSQQQDNSRFKKIIPSPTEPPFPSNCVPIMMPNNTWGMFDEANHSLTCQNFTEQIHQMMTTNKMSRSQQIIAESVKKAQNNVADISDIHTLPSGPSTSRSTQG